MDAWPLALFILLLFLNVPVTVAIGAGALLFFLHQRGLPLTIFPQRLSAFSQSFPLVAIPMFTFAGVIMNHSGITTRLLNLAETLVGHMSGALAQTNVLLATLDGFRVRAPATPTRRCSPRCSARRWCAAAIRARSPPRSSPPPR